MAFSPAEIKRLEDLSKEMVALIENTATSNEGAVAFGRIGKVCTRALALNAAQAAKRDTRAANISQFQAAREKRIQAKKGVPAGAAAASTQGQPRAQQRA